MKKSFYAILVLAAAAAVCSCEKNDSATGVVSARRIIPVVGTGEMTKSGGEQNLNYLKISGGFKMDIIAEDNYTDNGEAKDAGKYGETRTVTWDGGSWDGGSWGISPEAYWINNVHMSFWAYNMSAASACNITTPGAGATSMTFSYPKAGHTPDAQTDLLFDYVQYTHDDDKNHEDDTNPNDFISLSFNHALSKITFTKGTFTGVEDGYDISRISIIDIKSAGTCTFTSSDKSFAWSDQSRTASFDVSGVTWTDNKADKYFLVIPQNASTSLLQITLSKTAAEDIVLTAQMANYTMVAGKIYNYKLDVNISGDKDLDLTLTVLPWEYETRSIEIMDPEVEKILEWTGGTIDDVNKKIFVHNGMPVTGRFQLSHPQGAKLLLALDGNLDAFEVSPKICYIDGNPVNFSITPKVDDPKIDYETRLHIYLVRPDASVSELDGALMDKTGDDINYYTIVLPAQK